MISATLGILLVEVAVISLLAVSMVFFLFWKQKKTRTAEFEQLLQNIENQQGERKDQLAQYLTKDYRLVEDEAQESAEYMVEAEKQFMQLFIKQQIEQTPVSDFYGNLSELLDQYLYFIPKIAEQENNSESSISAETEEIEAEIKDIDALEQSNPADDPENTEDNSVDEGGDDDIKEPASKEDESEEEPDWGAAFAESGEEMDEEVKEGYEQEQKNE